MAVDVFSRTITDGGQQSTDAAVLVFAGAGSDALIGVGQLVQNLNIQYQQNIQRFYDLSSSKLFYVGGRTQGTATMGTILGPQSVSSKMYSQLGDICKVKDNNVDFTVTAGCTTGGSTSTETTYSCELVVMSALQLQVQAEQMVIQHNVTLTVGSLTAT